MFVHLISRPLTTTSGLPRSAVHGLADALRRAGAEVLADTAPAGHDLGDAVAACAAHLRETWQRRHPQVVHSVGVVATAATLTVRPAGMTVIATFDQGSGRDDLERALARRVDAVLPLSSAEQDTWRRRGVRTLAPGAMVVPAPGSQPQIAGTRTHVVSLDAGPGLTATVRSMPFWPSHRLVVLSRLDETARARLRHLAEELGVHERISYRPGVRGQERTRIWQEAALLVAGADGARHGGFVLEAASHGVAALAVASGAHLDHIVVGATGAFFDAQDSPRTLGRAVRELLTDPLRYGGLGAAAAVRLQALHDQPALGERVLNVYRDVLPDVPLETPTPVLTAERRSLAVDYLPLARQLAHRYAGRGQRLEDLIQVASLGLVRAAARFDPDLGTQFHSFAVPTILGELRRHFRDHAWAARVPRSLQEATLKVQKATDELRAVHGRDASTAQIAEHLGMLEQEVRQAVQARGEAMSSKSLDHPMGEGGDEAFGDLVGGVDGDLEYVELREAVRTALSRLPDRERQILQMRFFGERTQSEIAEHLGLSQVHVSRLITRTLGALRDHIMQDVPLPKAWDEDEAGVAGVAPVAA